MLLTRTNPEEERKRQAVLALLTRNKVQPIVDDVAPTLRRSLDVPPPMAEMPVAPSPSLLDRPEYAGLKSYDPATTPLVRYNNKARPIGVEGGDILTRENALLNAQEGYKAPVSKKQLALQAFLGFINHGIPGAIGSAANYGLNQDYRNQVTMGGDIANTQDIIQRELLQRKTANELANDANQRKYRDAQTEKALRPEGFNLSPGQHRFENGVDVANLPPLERTPAEGGFTLGPGQVHYGRNGEIIARGPDRPEKPDDSSFTNEQLQQNIREAQTERDRIGASLKDVPATITVPGRYEGDPPTVQANPAYTDLMSRYRQLDDHIREYRGRLKPGGNVLTRGGQKNKAFSISAYLSRNKGKTEQDARNFAASNYAGYTVVP